MFWYKIMPHLYYKFNKHLMQNTLIIQLHVIMLIGLRKHFLNKQDSPKEIAQYRSYQPYARALDAFVTPT